MKSDITIIRIGFVVLLAAVAWMLNPLANVDSINIWHLNIETKRIFSAVIGAFAAVLIIACEMRIRKASLKTLIGAAIGSIVGIVGASLIGMLISSQETAAVPAEMKTFLTVALAFFMAYIGLMAGAAKGEFIDLDKHIILKAAHPSPFSAHRGFLGCKHFSKINEYLTSFGKEPIDWQLPEVVEAIEA